MSAALLLVLLAAEPKPELVERLRRDIAKVKHTIEVTQELMKRSRGAHFEPDIHLRLAELYVEQSRYEYYLVNEQSGDQKEAPRARLLKEKAIELYQRILSEWPEYEDADKVLFYLAHEYRELGRLPEMVERYQELIEKHPKSKLVPDAHLVLGDYYFAKKENDPAREHYRKILEEKAELLADTANFKLGWTYLNGEPDYREALRYFEAAVKSDLHFGHDLPRADQEKLINVKQEAIADLAYTYTEVYRPKNAVAYFRSLAQSRAMYLVGIRKLADRYYLKEKLAPAAELYREFLKLSRDAEINLELHGKLYQATIKLKQFADVDVDVQNLLDSLDAYRDDWRIAKADRTAAEHDYELMARDLTTKAQEIAADKKDKELYAKVATAYSRYLTSFPTGEHRLEILANLGDSLFEAGRYIEAGDRYVAARAAASEKKDQKALEEASYSACAAFYRALEHKTGLTRLERIWALEGLKQNGLAYVEAFPKSEKVPEIQFNIARSFYEAGEFERAIGLFDEFIAAHPQHKSSVAAAELVLDSYSQLQDYAALAAKARAYAQLANLGNQGFKDRMLALAGSADERQIGAIILTSPAEAADSTSAADELKQFWALNKGSGIAEKVLYSAFVQNKEAGNFSATFETGNQFIGAYPKSEFLVDVLSTLSSFSLQVGDFEKAIAYLQELPQRFPQHAKAREMLSRAGEIQQLIGDHRGAIATFRQLKADDELLAVLEESGDADGAARFAEELVDRGAKNARAHLVVGLKALDDGDTEAAIDAFQRAVRASDGSEPDQDVAAHAAFELGEVLYRQFVALDKEGDAQAAAQARAELLPELEAAFTQAVGFNRGEWAVASLHRVGLAYAQFAAALERAPAPAGISEAEAEEYRTLLGEQVATLEKSSDEFFETCVAKARELPVLTAAALGCVEKKPEHPIEPLRAIGPPPATSEKEAIVKALMADPKDLKAIGELADYFLRSGQAGRAKFVISRGLELDENDAALHNKLGIAELRLGHPQAAYYGFSRAAELNHPYAAANLAALLMTFQDDAGAKKAVANLDWKGVPRDAADLLPSAKKPG